MNTDGRALGLQHVLPVVVAALEGVRWVRDPGESWCEVAGDVCGDPVARVTLQQLGAEVSGAFTLQFTSDQLVPCYNVGSVQLGRDLDLGLPEILARTSRTGWQLNQAESSLEKLSETLRARWQRMYSEFVLRWKRQFLSDPAMWLGVIEQEVTRRRMWGLSYVDDAPVVVPKSDVSWDLYQRQNADLFLQCTLGILPLVGFVADELPYGVAQRAKSVVALHRSRSARPRNSLADDADWRRRSQ